MKKRLLSLMLCLTMVVTMLTGITIQVSAEDDGLTLIDQSFAGLKDKPFPSDWTLLGPYSFETDYIVGTEARGFVIYKNEPFNTEGDGYTVKVSFGVSKTTQTSWIHIGADNSFISTVDNLNGFNIPGYTLKCTATEYDGTGASYILYKNGTKLTEFTDANVNYADANEYTITVNSTTVTISGPFAEPKVINDTKPVTSGYIAAWMGENGTKGSKFASVKLIKSLAVDEGSNDIPSAVEVDGGTPTPVKIAFDCKIDTATVNKTNAYLTDAYGNKLPDDAYTIECGSDEKSIVFLPVAEKLEYETIYKAVVTTGIKSIGGVALAENKGYLFVTETLSIASYDGEATDTTLFINSDSTDIYSNSVRKLYDKTFSSVDEYNTLSDWSISGDYEATDGGLVLKASTASAISNEENIGGKYTAKYCVVNPGGAKVVAYFNYKDAKNYYSLEVDSASGYTCLKKVVNSSATELSSATEERLKIDSGNKEIIFEIAVDNGDNISVWYTIDGYKWNFCKNASASASVIDSGSVGVGFSNNTTATASVKYIKVYKTPETDISNVSNTIEGKVVCYNDDAVGSAVVTVAFYNNGNLIDVFTKDVTVLEGINDFSIDVTSEKNLVGAQIKYFLFDNMSNIKPLVVISDNSSYRNEGFSDELEPYYPMFGTNTKTTKEMYDLVTDANLIANSTDKENADRLAVIDMYRKAGIDISADVSTATSSVSSEILMKHAPQTYSTLTPKPLTGDYEQAYSIDAPWNNPISKGNPKTKITSWIDDTNSKSIVSLQISTVKPASATVGNGLGIPIIVADENDGFETFAELFGSTRRWHETKAHSIRVPNDYSNLINNVTVGDRHAVFIDDTTKTAVHTFYTFPSDKEYNIGAGLLKNFDARAWSMSSVIDLTGIGNENHAGVNAAGIPMDAITVKKSDITDPNSDITHALGAALGTVMRSRVYPAYDVDSGVRTDATAVGCVPYGGVIQLDPSLDLEGIYAAGKLSLPGYKILKAWRDYGLYNVDRSSGNLARGHMLLYTSVTAEDWIDASNSKLTAPISKTQGADAVQAEIMAFLDGNSYFGLKEPVSCYVTVPVVKYTSYDANGDSSVTSDDVTLIIENKDSVITMDNEACDINKDGKITARDAELVTKYLNNEYPQSPKTYTITSEHYTNNRVSGNVYSGAVNVTSYHVKEGSNKKTYKVREGEYYSVAAIANNGFVFDGWENEELAEEKSNVVRVKATSDAHYAANFKRAPAVEVVYAANDETGGKLYYIAEDGSYVEEKYGTSARIKYGNYQCAFMAEPAEGYVFESWEVTADGSTTTYRSNILNTYVNSDTTIKVNFKKADVYDGFNNSANAGTTLTSPWTYKAGGMYARYSLDNDAYFADFTDSDGNKIDVSTCDECIIVNEDSTTDAGDILRVSAKVLYLGRGSALVVFGYNESTSWIWTTKSYLAVKINSSDNTVTVYSKGNYGAKTITTFECPNDLSLTSWFDVEIKTTSENKVSIHIYQGDREYAILENYTPNSTVTGLAGIGTANGDEWHFDNFAVFKN